MKRFRLVETYQGYHNKRDITHLPSNVLVAPSQNVLINDSEKIATRKGYELYGGSDGDDATIIGGYDWLTSTSTEINLRINDNVLEFVYDDEWVELMTDLPQKARFDTWWDNTQALDLLVFVVGDSHIYAWTGGITTFASATSNTITKQGTTSWGEDRFSGTGSVFIEGTEYTYTGGYGTDTLTGVTPDPTTAGHTVGACVHQSVVKEDNKPGGTDFRNDLIRTLYNQIYVASEKERSVFVSKATDYTDFSLTSPRKPGDPAVLTLDSSPSGFIPQEDSMYISGARDEWYQVEFTLSNDLLGEQLDIRRLKTGPGQGALSQEAISHIKNQVVFITNEPTLDTLGRLENIDTPQSKPLSDPIKLDFDNFDFEDVAMKYFKNNLYIAVPREGVIMIYDIERQIWQPPQVIPVSQFMIKGGELYGHSSVEQATYKLFTGSNDNGLPIQHKAIFSYRNYGHRMWKKTLDEWVTEGYISSNAEVSCTLNYDFGGYTTIKEFTINGDNESILFQPMSLTGIGKNSFGRNPLGSTLFEIPDLPKFRVINETTTDPFYELQVAYESYGLDQQWELLSFGGNARLSTHDNIEIKT